MISAFPVVSDEVTPIPVEFCSLKRMKWVEVQNREGLRLIFECRPSVVSML